MILRIILASVLLDRVISGRCGVDQYLSSTGKCKDCDFCPAGQGMNLEEEVKRNRRGEPLECRTCKPCVDGYYNNPVNSQYACMRCPSPCYKSNRKEYEPCGGSSRGHCGGCINSDYEDRENNLDSPCTKRVRKDKPLRVQKNVTKVEFAETNGIDVHLKPSTGLSVEWIALIITVTGILVIIVVLIVLNMMKKTSSGCFSTDSELGREGSSGINFIGASTSSCGETNIKCRSHLSNDTDLEADAPMLGKGVNTVDQNVHQELSFAYGLPSSGPECFHGNRNSLREHDYPTFRLTADDKYINYASKNIFDEDKINPMFRELGVSDQKIYAEHQLYSMQKQDYNDMTIHYLQDWIKKAGRNATFDVLCKALDKNEFNNVSEKLLELSREAV